METEIHQQTNDPVIDIALDTIRIGKQALIFVNTKSSAEKCAEEISKKIQAKNKDLDELGDSILHALSKPTKQCERLSQAVKKGIAFHHAGLIHKQRELIEDEFRRGKIKIICCTPTLAAGLNLPAFRVVIRDLKRYGHQGLSWIPVLEYHQQAGRAGRPGYDEYGVAITLAETDSQLEEIFERYINGEVEEIYSKLAVEPVLRTYLLSLIATGFVNTEKEILTFFSKTFWAHQFQDLDKLRSIIDKMLLLLEEWEFIKYSKPNPKPDFIPASRLNQKEASNEKIEGTPLGKKVAELYIDPLTAHDFVLALRNSASKELRDFSLLQMVSNTLEIRPLLKVKVKEWEDLQERLLSHQDSLLIDEPSMYDDDYDTFFNSIKTAFMLLDWIEEKDEEYLMGSYGVRPGELRVKQDIADWLLYSAEELSRILALNEARKEIMKLRLRLQHGVKEELLPLLKLKNIGRVRARKLFSNQIKDISDVKRADITSLVQLLGDKVAIDVKHQVGEEFDPAKIKVKENKRKGQLSLNDYRS
jgi:helicase